jgi:hypothetical protein
MAKQSFDHACETTLNKCRAIAEQRGGEYRDSWALENQHFPFSDMVRGVIRDPDHPEDKRIASAAMMCDVKLSRLAGGYKADTLMDLINYLASLTYWLEEYEEGPLEIKQAPFDDSFGNATPASYEAGEVSRSVPCS